MTKAFLCASAVVALAGAAQADLVTNGGFETGDFTGWTQFGDGSFTGVTGGGHSGSFEAYFGPTGGNGGIQQTLAVSAGDQVTIDFWYQAFGSTNFFSADLGSTNLVSFTNDTSHGAWTEFTFTVTAPSNNPTLSFTFYDPPSFQYLDDVSANAVPAPGSVALLGLGGLALGRRRRR